MIENKEYKGYWFLPSTPNDKIAGTLYFHCNNKITLELIGGFENTSFKNFGLESAEIIHGISSNSEKITLINCKVYGSLNPRCGFPMAKFDCQYIIIGKHLSLNEDKTFNRIVVEISSLYDWNPQRAIKHSISGFENGNLESHFTISESALWEKEVEINSSTNLRIYNTSCLEQCFNRQKTILSQTVLCEISNIDSKSDFIELLNKVNLFKQFLSLASLSSQEYLNITLYDNDDYHEYKENKKHFHPTTLLYIDKTENKTSYKTSEFLFTYSDIEKIYPELIKKWFEVKSEFAPIRNHLIESIKPNNVFTSLDFLIVIQALEGYHRRFISKEATLRTRLKKLLTLFDDIDKIRNSKIDLNHVIESRNYYSHFYTKNNKELDGVELYYLTSKLRNLLICCVLRLIGFDNELINKQLNENNKI
jgi:hypothetical protein